MHLGEMPVQTRRTNRLRGWSACTEDIMYRLAIAGFAGWSSGDRMNAASRWIGYFVLAAIVVATGIGAIGASGVW